MQEPRKSTLLFVQDAAAEPAALGAFAAEQPALTELADYITEMRKLRHPYDRGVAARKGIEF